MNPYTTNTHYTLDARIEKQYVQFRALKYARFLCLISMIVLLGSILVPALTHTSTIPQGTRASDQGHRTALSASHTAKSRRPTFLSHPFRVYKSAENGNMGLISRVLAAGTFSYTVVQQPENDPYYVSSASDLVTEFGLAEKYGVIGLIAHNNLAGSRFGKLSLGQEIQILYQDGHTNRYTVSGIYRFRALESTDAESRFQDLNSTETITAAELFGRMYTGAPHVTFQTCIYANGDNSWGRLFVIALPVLEPK
jgi:hypothetical protein